MLEPASRFFSSFGAVLLAFLLFPAQASAQLIQPNVILYHDPFSNFGTGLALSGDTLAIGSRSDGTVFIHKRNQEGPDHWGRVAVTNNIARTGSDVALSSDLLVAGKVANPSFPSDLGAASIFERNRGGADLWGIVLTLTPSDPADARTFGSSVAISGDTVAVGAGNFTGPSLLRRVGLHL